MVDPENAKKLGRFAGVDALILGTITPKGEKTAVTAKVITTDTAEIVGAGRAEFITDATVKLLVSRPVIDEQPAEDSKEKTEKNQNPKGVIKTFGDLEVEVQSLKIVNGQQYRLAFQLKNKSPRKTIYVAVRRSYTMGELNALITDAEDFDYPGQDNSIRGVQSSGISVGQFSESTPLKPNESISASAIFQAPNRTPIPGPCRLQMELISGHDFSRGYGPATQHNLVTKLEAD